MMCAANGRTVILGAGFSGLGAAIASQAPVYEAEDRPGGVCHSYYLDDSGRRLSPAAASRNAFRFEPAGGHWLFGASSASLMRLGRYGRLQRYERRAAVYLPEHGGFVPYPLQDNLRYLGTSLRRRILDDIGDGTSPAAEPSPTFKGWLLRHFGPTLCDLFFFPFNERYTAGLYDCIAPQDMYKSPVDLARVHLGARECLPTAGYNQAFHYPCDGLDRFVRAMAAACDLHVERRVLRVDPAAREVHFDNGDMITYSHLVSSLPLDAMLRLCRLDHRLEPVLATAVVVVNIGARRGPNCPPYHWVYVPRSRSLIHRIGFYSQVDATFLPEGYRLNDDVVSIYAERSFRSGAAPDAAKRALIESAIVEELQEWGFIGEALVVDSTYTDPAYTWITPTSTWTQRAMRRLADHGIRQIGRYGRWHFQGMVESFEQGLATAPRLSLPP